MTTVERVCAVLEANGTGHALIGAAALAARGVARSTYDIDLIISDVSTDLVSLPAAMQELWRTIGA